MWQRIFFAILLLVLLAQTVPLVLLYMEMPSTEEQRKNDVNFYSEAMAANLDGRTLSDSQMYMDLFNHAGPELWFELDNGEILAGTPVPGFTAQEREQLAIVESPRPGTRVWRGQGTWNHQADMPLDLLAVSLIFEDVGPATMFIIYPNYRMPRISANFYKGLAILVLAGALISYVVARHLSSPMRRLQKEVMAIDEKNLDQPISTSGTLEMAAVAKAINHLTAELGRYTRNMNELIANISHELRSPLGRMEGSASFIEDGFDRASRQVERLEAQLSTCAAGQRTDQISAENLTTIRMGLRHLTLLKEELNRMDNLVGTTLLTSRLNLNRPPPLHPIDLSALCREILRKRRFFISHRGIQVSTTISDDVHIFGDSILLDQMISNLVDNAAQYVTDQGTIYFSLESDDQKVSLKVANTHPPFSQEELIRLFDPFFRARKETGKGAGLGLSLVKKIADVHRARVSASNTAHGLCLESVFPGTENLEA